ncbi:hypothetical protein ACJMK2_010819 [Sinanodonta woodiana]|uniref:protein-glutamine gamma-glutamyltransferase n=1 Tax=Sinanodonta woodiana TaxID=1069815 RepID=A0ABD3VGM6_SINWO
MGCGYSRVATSVTSRTVLERDDYYRNHPGLHPPRRSPRAVSEVAHNLRGPDKEDTETIKVASVNLNIADNTKEHHTNEYDITEDLPGQKRQLVVRRGQSFTITLEFDRDYDESRDDLRLVFQFGADPLPSKQTHVEFELSGEDRFGQWGAQIKSKMEKQITIEIHTPSTLYVGKWAFKLDAVKKNEEGTTVFRYDNKDYIYILFNPWNPDDEVYHPDGKLLEEYILNDTGKIYAGNDRSPTAKPWFFGQFNSVVLDCALYLLDKSGMGITARGNPVAVSRTVSKMVNSPDDSGVLAGNWSGNYAGGTSPLDWAGSVAILEEFYKTKCPVKFGQCWVFSGLVTTVCRTLGIPARSVTNYSSAHDSDGSVSIDVYINKDMETLDHMSSDSIWNFHVWNDVWMARPDLPDGYGGWQAIDATPQETSEGVFCMGPASIKAIKNGELYLPYDGPFCYGEVNADKVIWMVKDDGSLEIHSVRENIVGKRILTKVPNNMRARMSLRNPDPDCEDITSQYKYKEGSVEERGAVRRAKLNFKNLNINIQGHEAKEKDVVMELVDLDDMEMGHDFNVTVQATNTSKDIRTVTGFLQCCSMYYTGVASQEIKKQPVEVILNPGQSEKLTMTVSPTDYLEKLEDHCLMRISYGLRVKETHQVNIDEDEFRLRKPKLIIKSPKEAKVQDIFKVEVSFENPLPVSLTGCHLMVEGSCLASSKREDLSNYGQKQTVVAEFSLKPSKAKKSAKFSVYFNCKQVSAITGHFIIDII